MKILSRFIVINTIKNQLRNFYGLKAKDYLSLNNKVLFNFMDIEELM